MPSGCFYGLARHRGGQEVAVLYQVEGVVLVLVLMLFIIQGVFTCCCSSYKAFLPAPQVNR